MKLSKFRVYAMLTHIDRHSPVIQTILTKVHHFDKDTFMMIDNRSWILSAFKDIIEDGKRRQVNVIAFYRKSPIPNYVNGFCTSKINMTKWQDPSLKATVY